MKIRLEFNTKSSGLGIPDAIRIAKKCNGVLDGKIYKVEFTSEKNNDLRKLLDLIGNLKSSKIFLDEEEVNPRDFKDTFDCRNFTFCKGICNHKYFEGSDIERFFTNFGSQI